jgi:hypothetical protein
MPLNTDLTISASGVVEHHDCYGGCPQAVKRLQIESTIVPTDARNRWQFRGLFRDNATVLIAHRIDAANWRERELLSISGRQSSQSTA